MKERKVEEAGKAARVRQLGSPIFETVERSVVGSRGALRRARSSVLAVGEAAFAAASGLSLSYLQRLLGGEFGTVDSDVEDRVLAGAAATGADIDPWPFVERLQRAAFRWQPASEAWAAARELGASERELARLCGWSRPYMRRVVRGAVKTVSLESAEKILSALRSVGVATPDALPGTRQPAGKRAATIGKASPRKRGNR